MSIERVVTAIEAIAAALTTIAAIAANTAQQTVSYSGPTEAGTTTGKTENTDKPVPEKKPARTRPEIAKATGIKVDEQDTALIVAKALVGKGEPEAPVVEPMDYEILKRAVIEVGSYNETGRQAVIKLLGDYSVKNAKDIPAEKREEFHGKIIDVLTDLQNAELVDNDDNAEFA